MGGWYHASKFALEALSDCMRYEIKPFGIDVVVIEPSATKSEWGNIAFDSLLKVSGNTAYKDLAAKTRNAFGKVSANISEAVSIAQLIKKAIESRRPETRYLGGQMDTKLFVLLKRVLSDKIMYKLIISQVK